jgi:hypothetical protein
MNCLLKGVLEYVEEVDNAVNILLSRTRNHMANLFRNLTGALFWPDGLNHSQGRQHCTGTSAHLEI